MTPPRAVVDALYADFAHALDHGHPDDLLPLFTPDAVYTSGGRRLVGPTQIRDRFAERSDRVTRHVCSGLRLAPVDERTVRASSVWVCFAANGPAPASGVPLYMVADFDDVLSCGPDGRWRIAERTITPVFADPAAAPRA